MKNDYGIELDRNGYAPSIMQEEERCYLCGKRDVLQRHEIYGSAFRNKSKAYGLWVLLCPVCHDTVHFLNAEIKMELREQGQVVAQEHYGWDRKKFRDKFGRCYL